LLRSESPLVGTGVEGRVALDSGDTILAEDEGEVSEVTGDHIVVKVGNKRVVHPLKKFVRSNQGTSINQKPIVREGDKVKKGQVLADGPSTELGELALGKNLLVAFMPWRGHNFEDAIVISERLVKDDVLTSIHIEEYEIEARDTKLGAEEITRDIPNVAEEALRDLDEEGIIRIGADVGPGEARVRVRKERVGTRPAGRTPDASPVLRAARSVTQALGLTHELSEGSTDSNIPMSLGIPAVTIGGGGSGEGAHSLQESWDSTNSWKGTQRALLLAIALTEPLAD
jgi:DNA-directed RNA polymerase beta subunit